MSDNETAAARVIALVAEAVRCVEECRVTVPGGEHHVDYERIQAAEARFLDMIDPVSAADLAETVRAFRVLAALDAMVARDDYRPTCRCGSCRTLRPLFAAMEEGA